MTATMTRACRVCCAPQGEPCKITPTLVLEGYVHAGRVHGGTGETCSAERGPDPVSGCEHETYGQGYDLCWCHVKAYRALTGCPFAGMPSHTCERCS